MSQQIINVGNTANDGTGDHLRVGGQKINANFTELYGMLGSGTVTSVAWTTSQGVSASIANATTTPNITITLGALTGITSLNGLIITANTGVITTGTWNATAVDATHGGTGATTVTQGNLLYGSAANVWSKLALGSALQVLRVNAGATQVEWATAAGITNGAAANEVAKSDGTNIVVSGLFSTTVGNLILGSASISGDRIISASSSSPDSSISLTPQASGNVIINGNQTVIAGTNNLNVRSVTTGTVYIGHSIGGNDFYVTQDTVLSRTIIGRRNAGGILQIQSNAATVAAGVTGSILFDITAPTGGGTYGNYAFNVGTLPSFGSGEKIIFYGDAITNPSGTISSGGVFFVKSSDHLPYWRAGTTEYAMTVAAGGGTVTSVAWTTSQGVSASIANSTTTPNITITLGALTGVTSFNGLVVTANTGAITTGTWSATTIGADKGGTGVANNVASTLTISGSFATTITVTAGTSVTLPTSGTLVNSTQVWLAASGATLTAANTITGTTTNTIKFLFDGLATAVTPDGAGLWLKNSTAATAGATIQNSPILTLDGTNWDGTVTRGNTWRLQNVPIPNASTSQGQLVFSFYFDGTLKDNALKIVGTNGGNAGYIDIASGTLRNSAGALALQSGTVTRLVLAITTGNATWTQSVSTTGVGPAQTFNFGAHTALTASTINNAFITSAVTRQYSTGALSNQALINFRSETIAFVGSSTATNPTTVQIDAPTLGTNATFTNPSALTLNGHLWFKTGGTVFGIVGSATNDNAVALNVGEYVSSLIATGSAVSLTTATAANITSISLTAGDWDVSGNVNFNETTSTVTARSAGISSTSATLPTDGSEAYNGVQSTVTSEINSITSPRVRMSLSGTTTIYLVGKATFSAGTCAGFGTLTARRIR